jgi:hypothetical protein
MANYQSKSFTPLRIQDYPETSQIIFFIGFQYESKSDENLNDGIHLQPAKNPY